MEPLSEPYTSILPLLNPPLQLLLLDSLLPHQSIAAARCCSSKLLAASIATAGQTSIAAARLDLRLLLSEYSSTKKQF